MEVQSKGDGQDNKMINVQWDESFFANLGALEATEEERKALNGLHDQLKSVREHLQGKESEIQEWLRTIQKHRTDIEERMAKKRKQEPPAAEAGGGGAAGAAGEPAAQPAAQPAPGAASGADGSPVKEARQARVAAEAERLSQAKFQADVLKSKAKGKGTAATADNDDDLL